MVWNAYLAGLWIWVPLLLFLVPTRDAPPRSMLLPSIVVAALASAYEAMIPRTANIRIDLLLLVPLLAVVHGISGLALAARAVQLLRKDRAALASALPAVLCLGVTVFIVVAWGLSDRHTRDSTARYNKGMRFAFEAAFRDGATQRRVFGDLHGDADGWAGYYVAAKPDNYPRRIVINESGQYWTFGDHEYMKSGRREPSPRRDEFIGKPGPRGMPTDAVNLSRGTDGRVLLSRSWGDKVHTYVYVREAPPRFPRIASASDRVTFKGVYSGHSARPGHVRVAQIWIWEADGNLWGKYLWQGFSTGAPNWVVAQRDANIECTKPDCRQIVVHFEKEMPQTLTWVSEHALELNYADDPSGKIVLQRGEVVPGFLYDLAPLTTVEENRNWLRSIWSEVTWDVPAHGSAGGK